MYTPKLTGKEFCVIGSEKTNYHNFVNFHVYIKNKSYYQNLDKENTIK